MNIKKLHDTFLFNYLANDMKNAMDIMEAGGGFVVPGIAAGTYQSNDKAIMKLNGLKKVSDIISVGLGDGGNAANWKRVLDIAVATEPGHINQPFEMSAYVRGYLAAKQNETMVNALVQPTGEKGKVKLTVSGQVLGVEAFMEMASHMGVQSIKVMPINGVIHLEELIYVTEMASKYGIRGVEPAGGINVNNIKQIIDGVKHIDIEFFMPHIFGSAIDPETNETIPSVVADIYKQIKAL